MQYFGFDRPSFALRTLGFGANFDPLELFAWGKQGVWFDPSDKSTLFQDVAGTVPVTKDGDPVGLMKDKSGNGNHATQAVSTARPTYPGLTYDGVDDAITFPIPASGIFDILITMSTTDDKFVLINDAGGSPYVFGAEIGGDAPAVGNANNGIKISINGTTLITPSTNSLYQVIAGYDGNTIIAEITGIDISSFGGIMGLSNYATSVWGFSGKIGSIIFRESMSEAERTAAREYLAKKAEVTL